MKSGSSICIAYRSGANKAYIRQTLWHLNSGTGERDLCVSRYSNESLCASFILQLLFHIFPYLALYVFPACSLNGSPSLQRWYFAVQACKGITQVRHWDSFAIGIIYVARNLAKLPLCLPTTVVIF